MYFTFSGEKGSGYLQKKESYRISRKKDKMEYVFVKIILYQTNLVSLWTKELFWVTLPGFL